ncbi:Alpha/Beta hydrolase protein [Lactifluus volemus]|nr:Alpha/Beta hydrolase protein [Lactifluus volemus]
MANDLEQPFRSLSGRRPCPPKPRSGRSGWERGAPLSDIKRLVERWKNGYDWRTHERELNELPMFMRSIEVEGFGPGSFIEVTKVLPLLTGSSPEHPSFHVVAPSLPGFAWSQGVLKKGFHGKHYAELTLITASLYGPKNVKASHTNMPISDPINSDKTPWDISSSSLLLIRLARYKELPPHKLFQNRDGLLCRAIDQATTLGAHMGLIYWFSRAGPAASVRIYYELTKSHEVIMLPKSTVPIGISFFPKELARFPRGLLRAKAKVVFESEHDTGGHFAAYEEPEALVDDLRKMFGKSGPAASVVPGCPGY